MKVRIRCAVLVALAAATLVIGFLLAPRSEAGGGKPVMVIPLMASFRQVLSDPPGLDKILGDDKGPYIHGVTGAGYLSVHLVGTQWQNGGNFYMEADNEGDDNLGRAVGFLFDDWRYSCTIDSRKDSELYKDFAVGSGSSIVKSRWFQFKTFYTYKKNPISGRYNESLEVLNFTAMDADEIAYVGMSMYIRVTLDAGAVSDEYYVGFRWDPVEVQVMEVDLTGRPVKWAIRPVQDPAVYTNIYQSDVDTSWKPYLPTRMLLQIHYPTGGKRNVGYQSQCYGLYNLPFELLLTRMQ